MKGDGRENEERREEEEGSWERGFVHFNLFYEGFPGCLAKLLFGKPSFFLPCDYHL